METFAQRLNQALKMRNIRQSHLAKQLQIGDAAITNYLRGRYEPQEDRLVEIAEALCVNKEWLRGYDVPMEIGQSYTQVMFGEADPPNETEKLLLNGYRKCSERDKAIIDLIISSYLLK